jgi:hypothetical protein
MKPEGQLIHSVRFNGRLVIQLPTKYYCDCCIISGSEAVTLKTVTA